MLNIISAEDRLKEKRGHKIVIAHEWQDHLSELRLDRTLFMD